MQDRHDIFCFPTQMAISSAVRALLSSVQVGEGGREGKQGKKQEVDWTGCDARMPEKEEPQERPSRRFITMIIRLGSGACVFAWSWAADGEEGRTRSVGDGTEGLR